MNDFDQVFQTKCSKRLKAYQVLSIGLSKVKTLSCIDWKNIKYVQISSVIESILGGIRTHLNIESTIVGTVKNIAIYIFFM